MQPFLNTCLEQRALPVVLCFLIELKCSHWQLMSTTTTKLEQQLLIA